MALHTRFVLFATALATLAIASPSEAACNRIIDTNKRFFCMGVTTSSPRLCHQITIDFMKHTCLANATQESRHCYDISRHDDRELCLSTTGPTSHVRNDTPRRSPYQRDYGTHR